MRPTAEVIETIIVITTTDDIQLELDSQNPADELLPGGHVKNLQTCRQDADAPRLRMCPEDGGAPWH